MYAATSDDDGHQPAAAGPNTPGRFVTAVCFQMSVHTDFRCTRAIYLAQRHLGRIRRPLVVQTGPNLRNASYREARRSRHTEMTEKYAGREDTRWPSPY